MNRSKLIKIIKEEAKAVLSEVIQGEPRPPGFVPSDTAGLFPDNPPSNASEAAVMALQAFILGNLSGSDFEQLNMSPLDYIQKSGRNKGLSFIDGKFGPLTRKGLSLIQDEPAPSEFSITQDGSGKFDMKFPKKKEVYKPNYPHLDPEPGPSPEPSPEPGPSPEPKPEPRPSAPKSVFEQIPKNVNLATGDTTTLIIQGKKKTLRFTNKAMELDGVGFKFFQKGSIMDIPLKIDEVKLGGAGKVATMKMSFGGQSGSAKFTEDKLLGIFAKLESAGQADVSAAGKTILIRKD